MAPIPGMVLIGGVAEADVEGMGWRPGGGQFEVVKLLKAASATVSPAAVQAAATARRLKGRRGGSVIENVLPGDHSRRQAVCRRLGRAAKPQAARRRECRLSWIAFPASGQLPRRRCLQLWRYLNNEQIVGQGLHARTEQPD